MSKNMSEMDYTLSLDNETNGQTDLFLTLLLWKQPAFSWTFLNCIVIEIKMVCLKLLSWPVACAGKSGSAYGQQEWREDVGGAQLSKMNS